MSCIFCHLMVDYPRSRLASLAAALGFLLPLTSCGKAPAADHKNNEVQSYRALSEEQAQSMLDHAQVSCPDANNCHESVAMIVIRDELHVSTCTAFLVAPNIMATNSHCIPQNFVDKAQSCRGNLKALFPAFASHAATTADCAEIISKSKLQTQTGKEILSPDYAFFRLSAPVTDREYLAPSRQGFKNDDWVRVVKINPKSQTDAIGEMASDNCQVTYRTPFVLDFAAPSFPLPTFTNCRIVLGNSGSPLIGSNGNVLGVISSRITDNGVKRYEKLLTEPTVPVSIGTNFSCVNSPAIAGVPTNPELCSYTWMELGSARIPSTLSSWTPAWILENKKQFAESVQDWQSRLSSLDPQSELKWRVHVELDSNSSHYLFMPQPKCYLESASRFTQSPTETKTFESEGDLPYRRAATLLNRRFQSVPGIDATQKTAHVSIERHAISGETITGMLTYAPAGATEVLVVPFFIKPCKN